MPRSLVPHVAEALGKLLPPAPAPEPLKIAANEGIHRRPTPTRSFSCALQHIIGYGKGEVHATQYTRTRDTCKLLAVELIARRLPVTSPSERQIRPGQAFEAPGS